MTQMGQRNAFELNLFSSEMPCPRGVEIFIEVVKPTNTKAFFEEGEAISQNRGKRRGERSSRDGKPRCFAGAVEIPITGVLDLHTFSTAEFEPLLEDYLEECLKRNILEVRIIHGKGMGVQRRRVQSILARSPLVLSYRDADPDRGGWGATIAVLAGKGSR